MARANVEGDGCGHDADGAGPRDQHVFAHQIKAQGRVHRIAQRVQDRANVVGYGIGQGHHVKRRKPQILRKSARFIHPDAARRRVKMKPPRPALA